MVYLTAQDRDALSVNTNHLISKTSWEFKKKTEKQTIAEPAVPLRREGISR